MIRRLSVCLMALVLGAVGASSQVTVPGELILGQSWLDVQQPWGMGKTIVVAPEGTVHCGLTREYRTSYGTMLRAATSCVSEDGSFIFPTNVINVPSRLYQLALTWYAEAWSTLPAFSSERPYVAGWSYPWLGRDFQGCTQAYEYYRFETSGRTIVRASVDLAGKTQTLVRGSGDEQEELVYYRLSDLDPAILEDSLVVSDAAYGHFLVLSAQATTATALIWSEPYDGVFMPGLPAEWQQWVRCHDDRQVDGDLRPGLEQGPYLSLAGSPESLPEWALCEHLRAGGDFDAVYDRDTYVGLHFAWMTPFFFCDSLLIADPESDVLEARASCVRTNYGSALWHRRIADGTGTPTLISSRLTADSEADAFPCPGLNHAIQDRVQLAVDPQTGDVYAAWNSYSASDTRAPGSDGLRMPNAEIMVAVSHDNGSTWTVPQNVTQTATPGCETGECASETNMSLAAEVYGGQLHFIYVRDLHAGDSHASQTDSGLFQDGSEATDNDWCYLPVDVDGLPGAFANHGHVGLAMYHRAFLFEEGHPTQAEVHDKVLIVNEYATPVRITEVDLLHDNADNVWSEEYRCGWEVAVDDEYVLNPVCTSDWNGEIPAHSVLACRVYVGHDHLPNSDQLFRFAFSTGEERVYRFAYQDSLGNSLVERLDAENFSSYNVRMLYRSNCEDLVTVDASPLPMALELLPAWPNPFNPVTHVAFVLPQAGQVRLEVFDLAGRRVSTLVNGSMAAGQHEALFDGGMLASGVYFSRLSAGSEVRVGKLMLIK